MEKVKEIVRQTIDELFARNMIKCDDELSYKYMSKQLRMYYKDKLNWIERKTIGEALREIESDQYYGIMIMCHEKEMTIEEISEKMKCDIRTVARNKKRLTMEVYRKIIGKEMKSNK